jgi:transcriptional regulator with XRE-family HTH domain
MRRHITGERRTKLQSAADQATHELQVKLGRALRDARARRRLTQAQAADIAGISRSEWSGLELGSRDATLWMVNRAAHAVGTRLNAYLPEASAADQPRDAVQLKGQELVIATAKRGGWEGSVEERLDAQASTSRYGDVVLRRPRRGPTEVALMEIIDWFDDVGGPMRGWQSRLEALERRQIARMTGGDPLPSISGCWVVRATHRNRELVGAHANVFRARFRGSARAWLAALSNPTTAMPHDSALLWISVEGERLFASRLG